MRYLHRDLCLFMNSPAFVDRCEEEIDPILSRSVIRDTFVIIRRRVDTVRFEIERAHYYNKGEYR